MKLLIRPTPFPGESWPGFLWRTAALNSMSGLGGIASMLGILPSRLIASSPASTLQAIGIQLADGEGIVLHTSLHPEGEIRLARVGRTFRTRICPECIREEESPFIRADWDAAATFVCSRHKTTLIDECPRCRLPLSYERRDILICVCGCSLKFSLHDRVQIDPEPIQKALSLQASQGEKDTFAPSTTHEIYAAWLLKRLALAQSGFTRSKRAQRFKGDAFISVGSALDVYPWFVSWPNGFIGQLALAQAKDNRPPGDMFGMTRNLLQQEFPVVADAVEEFDRRKRTARRPNGSLATQGLSPERSWVGLKNLMRMTGCTYHTIQGWIRLGWLGEVKTARKPDGSTQYFIDVDRALHAVEMAKRTATIKHMAKEVGLDGDSLRALIRAGVLQAIPFGVAKWNVRVVPSEVFQLTQKLLGAAVRGRPVHTDTILLGVAIRILDVKNPSQLASFIRAVLSGAVRVRVFVNAPLTLEEITIRKADLQPWM